MDVRVAVSVVCCYAAAANVVWLVTVGLDEVEFVGSYER